MAQIVVDSVELERIAATVELYADILDSTKALGVSKLEALMLDLDDV